MMNIEDIEENNVNEIAHFLVVINLKEFLIKYKQF